jgi:hypothetical protein
VRVDRGRVDHRHTPAGQAGGGRAAGRPDERRPGAAAEPVHAGPAAAQRDTTTGLPTPNKGTASASVDSTGAAAAHAPERKQPTSHPVPAEDPINKELVRRYYDLLASQPGQAIGLLDDVLRSSDLSHFVLSWSQIQRIQVIDVQQREDGSLLAIVEMLLPDGGTTRVNQLLTVSKGSPQRITGAQIISAQRT